MGLYFDDGGCKAEMCMTWEVIENEPTPRLKIYSDGFCLLGESAFKELLNELNSLEDHQIAPNEFCNLLIRLGFRDMSDTPLAPQ